MTLWESNIYVLQVSQLIFNANNDLNATWHATAEFFFFFCKARRESAEFDTIKFLVGAIL